jgi:hypothetical protein
MENAKKPKRLNTVNVRLDDATLEQLRAIALDENRTVSNLIDTMIKDALTTWPKRSSRPGAKGEG